MRTRRIAVCLSLVVAVALLWGHSAWGAGKGKDNARVLGKVKFIHYRKGRGKPPWAGGGGGGGGGKKEDQGHYTYIANGARWRETEDYRLNTANGEKISKSDVLAAVLAGVGEWESAANASPAVFGQVVVDGSATYNDGAYRGHNTLSFASMGNPNIIAVTSVWGYFGGPKNRREIVEAHMLFNDDYVWGDASADDALMDIENIAVHELGHVFGMGDLYDPAAGDETMYGYSTEGEVKKRDLFTGDAVGVRKLYK